MSDLEEFALDVLQRAKARSKVLKETLGRPDVAPDIETKEAASPVHRDENADISAERDEDEYDDDDDDLEEDEIPVKKVGQLPTKSIVAGPGSGVANENLSDSPARRTRLRALAHTINNWDDDYSHHYTPQSSRFNLSKPPKSPLRKLPSSPSTTVAAPSTAAVAAAAATFEASEKRVRLETKSVTAKSSVDTVDSRPLTVSQQIEQLCSAQLVVASVEKSFDECDASYSSSIAEDISIACCSEGETSKNSELSDSFTYFAPKAEIGRDGTNVDNVPSDEEKAKEKCVLDDSVIHALAAQGYVHSPASAKLYYEYKDKDQKDGKPQQYQLPGPKKTESPVKRAASPVRPVPVCTRSPSPTRPVPIVADSGPRVVDLVRKQFEVVEKTNQDDKPKSMSTGARLDANTSRLSVAQKAAMYESMNASTVKEVDPTELSVAERMKLFEKKKSGPAGSSFVPRPPSPTRAGPTNVATRRPPRPSMVPAMPLKDRLKLFEQGVKEEDSDEEGEGEESDEPRNFRSKMGPIKPDVVPMGVPPPPPPPQVPPPRTPSPKRAISLAEAVRTGSPKRQHPSNLQEIREADSSSDEDVTMVQSPGRSSPKKEVSFCVPRSPGKITSSPTAKRSASPTSRRSMSPTAKRSMSPKANYPGARDVKRIRVNEPKAGRIYPSLTDIETTETETDTDVDHADIRPMDADEEMDSETSIVSGVSSLGTYIERKAIENSPLRGNEVHRRYRPSEDFNASLACRQVDALIDEALEGQDYSMSIDIGNSSPVATSSPLKNNQRSPSPVGKLLNQNLVHTVSFYRRQQTLGVASPKVTLTPKRIPVVIQEEDPIEERTFSVEDKVNEIIKKLEAEAQAQQRSMAQASKALSLCKATMEFSDSRENVECERVLLIATQKHSALVNEIHRLKTEGILGRRSSAHSPSKGECAPSCKGNMTIHEIAVELKREFLSRATKGETVYHFLALVKYRNQLEASSLLSLGSGVNSSHLHAGVLHFPNTFCVTNLEPDFKVTMEVFVLETLREYLPHEAKYHIKKLEKNKLTPKKTKGDSHSKFTHFQHSPAGPDAIQACKFKSVSSLCIDISTLHRNHWQFERVLAAGPLEGSVAMRIQCSAEGGVEERGFLTMFTDISGFGDWHRRWCKLTSTEMSYWMYPEDEPNQEPLGRIALRNCVTSRVGAVPRDVCARANTFLLVTTRPPLSGDKDTLVTSCHGDYTAVRHLISADTREERDLWCKQFNRALANLRAWDPHAHSPDDTLF